MGDHIRKKSDVIGVGLNWSRTYEGNLGLALEDQYTAEIYYRIKVL